MTWFLEDLLWNRYQKFGHLSCNSNCICSSFIFRPFALQKCFLVVARQLLLNTCKRHCVNIFKNKGNIFKTEDIAIPKRKHFLFRQLSRLGILQTAGFCKSGGWMIHLKLFICTLCFFCHSYSSPSHSDTRVASSYNKSLTHRITGIRLIKYFLPSYCVVPHWPYFSWHVYFILACP